MDLIKEYEKRISQCKNSKDESKVLKWFITEIEKRKARCNEFRKNYNAKGTSYLASSLVKLPNELRH